MGDEVSGEDRSVDDMARFIVSGYLELPPSEPASVHADVHAQILACGLQAPGTHRTPYGLGMLDGDAAGNNILHAAPALRGGALLENPRLVESLTGLLGPAYRIHPHRRAHLRRRGAHTTMWHVDAYKGLAWSGGRHHEPHWVMVCYYPQDVTLEMGPTELLPGRPRARKRGIGMPDGRKRKPARVCSS